MKNVYKTIIEQSPISIVITDKKGNISYVNPKFLELTGYKAEEVIGKNPRILKSGETSDQEYKHIWDTILSGNVWRGEFINKKKNGELYNEFAVISPIIDDDGKINRLIGLKEDITELKKIQEELKRAEKLKGLSKMASYISHEIKSPLSAIKMNIDMLMRKNDLPGYAKKSLSVVTGEITRLFNLLTNIMEYSRHDNLLITKIYLPEFFNIIHEIFCAQFEEKGIQFFNNVSEHIISGDMQKLKSVFILMIENSIAAISENGIIEVISEVKDSRCSIFLKDNGFGIDDSKDIFEPFYTTKQSGAGLGLTIAKNIIDKHNGDIKLLSSKPGETIFEVNIPLEN